ncbi:ABC transporter permease [Rhodanobacter sp. DHB23]|uniref:ABC transporter permease n=1 Tax=Rhodanobacter sp. DHB23 TaxID=2775923 RepID=UPI00178186C9|nr:ABC transporter permease [Rhodanobacter sp. DHB23]MBD8871552.1 ABC transporter permease [Rhodanobacter sp. DHB23]
MFGYYLDLALRSLKRNKVLTVLMVLAIAVGIGASMTTLTVMHILSGDPLPGRSAHLFYAQLNPDIARPHAKEPAYVMDYHSAMDLWGAHRADRQALIVNSAIKVVAPESAVPPLQLDMLSTTTDFFPMFGVPFHYGSGWSADDDAQHARVVVISDDLNNKLFGGANSVGRTLRLGRSDLHIVGVLKPWRPAPLFYEAWGNYTRPQDVMTPLTSGLEINDGHFMQFTCWDMPSTPGHLQNAPCEWVGLWVQLDDAAKVSAYKQFLGDYAAQQKSLGRFTSGVTRLRSLMQWLDYLGVVPDDVRLQNWLAFAFLAICLFNTIGLLLAKFLRRSGEIGVRRALGASRAAIFAQCLVEAGLLGLLGGIGGWLLTMAGLWLVRRQPTDYADLIRLDLPMFLATFAVAIATSVLAGVLPAWRACRVAPALQLKAL